jgi:hypothetical protein
MVSNRPSYLIHALRNAPKIQLHTQAELLYKIAITKATRWNLRSLSYQAGFNPEPIIDGMPESLLAAQVFFRRLHRNMTEQKLDSFQLASRILTEPSARPPEIVWREF